MAKYDGLHHHLDDADDGPVEMTFAEIERLVGPLPRSARTYVAWWENEAPGGSHVQARAWLDAGRRVEHVDLNAGVVSFGSRRQTRPSEATKGASKERPSSAGRLAERRAALKELTAEASELGLYNGEPADYATALKSARHRRASVTGTKTDHGEAVSASDADRARYVLDTLGPRIAAVGVGLIDPRPLRAWAQGVDRPRGDAVNRLRILFRVTEAVGTVYGADTAAAFVRGANPGLDDESVLSVLVAGPPTDAIETRLMGVVRDFIES